MPNQFSGTVVLKNGSLWMRQWPDHELVNNKPEPGWESLGMINGNLIQSVYFDYAGNKYLIPQTIAGVDSVEIDVDFDEFQEWYKAFTTQDVSPEAGVLLWY